MAVALTPLNLTRILRSRASTVVLLVMLFGYVTFVSKAAFDHFLPRPIPIQVRNVIVLDKDSISAAHPLIVQFERKVNEANCVIYYHRTISQHTPPNLVVYGDVTTEMEHLPVGDWTIDNNTVVWPALPPGQYDFRLEAHASCPDQSYIALSPLVVVTVKPS